ncbi:uncharacterized protein LOC111393209 [Olea europaea var. sylvestris]|uniref:uncharacterized protein LOC111393209 n=1 Tax=Olea europaea var. sylvestris TaxID=158386 RepID=UPI000C1CF52B|nr:uncharacterized protein LOC111393209 [Olea europaea var. sylvestris]
MEFCWKIIRRRFMGKFRFPLQFLFCCCFFFFSYSCLRGIYSVKNQEAPLGTSCVLPRGADIYLQKLEKNLEENNNWEIAKWSMGGARRLLGGPGSSPPRCTSKCGRCTPCKPVHVPVPPGTPVTTEYYPEAWRCKCGNKLYLP